ncbi:hypothetical protein BU24DRAFT_413775 [Aaosphaeria arxii CBS 175.79]|uniref:Uncharacterized protein n=1 Tax=Aaosphaeria arxii CBS 175.79 TaxID=1450172 RepID=A0A6A5XFD9_9PLEO|nr:uncharacterized protein BU24DRAFT_413775 [Aaosphaeria arxii CBS 175.79]KAF2011094.1 hypothetical protein BU24DRAFT_413775 [Aaosphaeria arxii CBS 175.79]
MTYQTFTTRTVLPLRYLSRHYGGSDFVGIQRHSHSQAHYSSRPSHRSIKDDLFIDEEGLEHPPLSDKKYKRVKDSKIYVTEDTLDFLPTRKTHRTMTAPARYTKSRHTFFTEEDADLDFPARGRSRTPKTYSPTRFEPTGISRKQAEPQHYHQTRPIKPRHTYQGSDWDDSSHSQHSRVPAPSLPPAFHEERRDHHRRFKYNEFSSYAGREHELLPSQREVILKYNKHTQLFQDRILEITDDIFPFDWANCKIIPDGDKCIAGLWLGKTEDEVLRDNNLDNAVAQSERRSYPQDAMEDLKNIVRRLRYD